VKAFTPEEAERRALWEKLDSLTGQIVEKADRILMGDEAYEYSREVAADVRRMEHEMQLERMREIIALSRRNRGES
jgi:hypothetical protein